jgi:hypothetical protein
VGFIAIYVIAKLYERDSHWWPLIPGVILILIGVPKTAKIFRVSPHGGRRAGGAAGGLPGPRGAGCIAGIAGARRAGRTEDRVARRIAVAR